MTPDDYTIQESFLEVGDGHSLYIHDWGNRDAKLAIIYLHGGPGSGCKDKYKQAFDPTKQRVIFFDQRGAGKSLPYGSLEHNTTDDLVDDITKIANHLKLDSFVLTGGSWGSCLALAYGLKHPERVQAMVLHGIYTGSKPENAWLDQGMFRIFYPDVWDRYLDATPEQHQEKPWEYHFKNMLGDDPDAAKRSAFAYSNLEGGVMKLDDRITPESYETFDPASTLIEVHYMAHDCFMPNNRILNNAHKLQMPIWLVQGRYDMVCPPKTAHSLSQALPKGELVWATSGHMTERESWNIIRLLLRQLTA